MIQDMFIKIIKLFTIIFMSFIIHKYAIYPFAKVDENTDILTKLIVSMLAIFILHDALNNITRDFPRVRAVLIWVLN